MLAACSLAIWWWCSSHPSYEPKLHNVSARLAVLSLASLYQAFTKLLQLVEAQQQSHSPVSAELAVESLHAMPPIAGRGTYLG